MDKSLYNSWEKAINNIDLKKIGQLLHQHPQLVNQGIIHTRGNGTTFETLPLNMVNQSIEAVKILLEAGAAPNEYGDGNVLALHNASVEVTKYLISKGTDVNKIGYEECTPLMYEVYMRNHENVRILIKHGAEVNYQRQLDGYTSLHFATEKGDVQMIEILLNEGALSELKNDKGKSPLDIAKEKNLLDFFKS